MTLVDILSLIKKNDFFILKNNSILTGELLEARSKLDLDLFDMTSSQFNDIFLKNINSTQFIRKKQAINIEIAKITSSIF